MRQDADLERRRNLAAFERVADHLDGSPEPWICRYEWRVRLSTEADRVRFRRYAEWVAEDRYIHHGWILDRDRPSECPQSRVWTGEKWESLGGGASHGWRVHTVGDLRECMSAIDTACTAYDPRLIEYRAEVAEAARLREVAAKAEMDRLRAIEEHQRRVAASEATFQRLYESRRPAWAALARRWNETCAALHADRDRATRLRAIPSIVAAGRAVAEADSVPSKAAAIRAALELIEKEEAR
jgi:hypothetical protein